jgi:NADH:ubiquinone oxidoreductase subunit 6 (subunit J)
MHAQVSIRSRSGNIALAVFGLLAFVGAIAVLLFFVATTWSSASLADRVLQAALVLSALAALYFLQTAARSLGSHSPFRLRRS